MPWLCFGLAILYGARQTAVQRQALQERGVWMMEVTEFIERTEQDRWSVEQTDRLLRWIETHGRLPSAEELPEYSPGELSHPIPPRLLVPD